ncbi:hypothetical protein PRIPAC_72385 [Pristionchus pacificus]|uniref:Uncharacterized protein n=1 Tax=Pristionchus pacificus TaxID=54126 RepID=A0A2A6C729_PRIPA|nr:hypothetical protein PRIPAC_72385 [Pristionchus pacificus]|eukprot:PDM73995.1 hypothetical protein PRIPAC_41351 [Pristionchus pacificus]
MAEYIRELQELDEVSALAFQRGIRYYGACHGCFFTVRRERAICTHNHVFCLDCIERHPCSYVRLIQPDDFSRECRICFTEPPPSSSDV